jgi:hypothetical protein
MDIAEAYRRKAATVYAPDAYTRFMIGVDAPVGLHPAPRSSRRTRLRRGIAIGTGLVAVAAVGTGASLLFRPQTIRGRVVEVVARDIGHASTVTIRDLDGRDHVLDVDAAVDMTPGHLREHMMFGEPVTATLATGSGTSMRPVIVRIVDGLQ